LVERTAISLAGSGFKCRTRVGILAKNDIVVMVVVSTKVVLGCDGINDGGRCHRNCELGYIGYVRRCLLEKISWSQQVCGDRLPTLLSVRGSLYIMVCCSKRGDSE
jgi:hypothetical protein